MTTLTMRGLRAATHSPLSSSAKYTQYTFQPPRIHLQLRYATSSSTSLKRAPPPSPLQKSSDSLNGPITTLPAPLDLPTRDPSQNLFTFLLATGRCYVAFYKTGVKNIYTNYQLSKKIQSRLGTTPIREAVDTGKITRSEFQLLHRNKHDMKRVPLFALVLLVCGEFTPLVVLAFSGVVPWTCRIPKQIDGDRRKLEERRAKSDERYKDRFPIEKFKGEAKDVGKLDEWKLRHINSRLGLSSRLWEAVWGPPLSLLKYRVRKRMEYLEMDDYLISRAGGFGGLSVEELKMACVERGVDVRTHSEAQMRKILKRLD